MKYWTVIPSAIKRSNKLTSEEKDLYYTIFDNLNAAHYCDLSNEELAQKTSCGARSITLRLANMKEKGFLNIVINPHKQKRLIYINMPRSPDKSGAIPDKPLQEDLEPKTRNLIEALKKSIVFGTIDFNVLVEKLLESPYLENVEDNSKQFILTDEQIMFLAEFKKLGKTLDCQLAIRPKIDYVALLKAIKESNFLLYSKNLNLKFMLENAQAIIDGKYRDSTFLNKTETYTNQRNYTKQELNSYFQSLDEINF